MRKTIRIAIEDEAHKQAKARAALEGVTLAAFIEAAIVAALAKPVKRAAQKKGVKKST